MPVAGQAADHAHCSHELHESHDSGTMTHADTHHQGSDCDQQCLNCTMHCFSMGIAARLTAGFSPDNHLTDTLAGEVLIHIDLLFRPPI